ncbi:MAG: ABC-2 transporter permease [Clostridia bacterium]
MKKNIYIGLIIKDLLTLKSYAKTIVIFMCIFIISGFMQKNPAAFLLPMVSLIFGMCAVATFSYDEFSNTNKFLTTLPLTKKDIVSAKFLLIFLGNFIGILLGSILSLGIMLFTKDTATVSEFMLVCAGLFTVLSFFQCVLACCIYKWGITKAQIYTFAILGITALLGAACSFIFTKLNIQLTDIFSALQAYGVYICITVSLLVYYVSYRFSCAAYSKTEL